MSDDEPIRVTVNEQSPIRFQTHKIGGHLLFDGHGLSPYYGLVSVFEPDHAEDLEPFEAVGDSWEIVSSTYWSGKLADPEGRRDGGMYEYSYRLAADDDVGDRDVNFQLRPAFPDARHCETGDPIGGLPDELPYGIRVQVQSTNLERQEITEVLVVFADAIGLNPDYFRDEPHEWSRISALEAYVRLDRGVMEDQVTAEGGILHDLSAFASEASGRGEYKWDHEAVQGHYEAVALDPETWGMLIPEQRFGKRAKSYHPEKPRGTDTGDPLYHPKFELQFSPEYDDEGTVPWDGYGALRDELEATGLNLLQWAGVPTSPTDTDGETFVPDAYFEPEPGDDAVPIHSNPIPDLRDLAGEHIPAAIANAGLGEAQEEVLEAVEDGGAMHYEDLATTSGTSSSTVYRTLEDLRGILSSDEGIIGFADSLTREQVGGVLRRLEDVADWGARSLREAADRVGLLEADSPLAEWMDKWGARLVDQHPELHFNLGGHLTEYEVRKLLRAGYEAAKRSGLEDSFREAVFSWRTPEGQEKPRRRGFVRRPDGYQILARVPLEA